jgi:hypothetical protein
VRRDACRDVERDPGVQRSIRAARQIHEPWTRHGLRRWHAHDSRSVVVVPPTGNMPGTLDPSPRSLCARSIRRRMNAPP